MSARVGACSDTRPLPELDAVTYPDGRVLRVALVPTPVYDGGVPLPRTRCAGPASDEGLDLPEATLPRRALRPRRLTLRFGELVVGLRRVAVRARTSEALTSGLAAG